MNKKPVYLANYRSKRGFIAGCVTMIVLSCITFAFPFVFLFVWDLTILWFGAIGLWGVSIYAIILMIRLLKRGGPEPIAYIGDEDEPYFAYPHPLFLGLGPNAIVIQHTDDYEDEDEDEDEDSYIEDDGDSPELNAASSFEPPTPAEMLDRYRDLVERGYMSEEEFQQKRLALLGPDSPEPDESSAQPSADSSNIASQLTDLANLLDRGLISRDEFDSLKQDLMQSRL